MLSKGTNNSNVKTANSNPFGDPYPNNTKNNYNYGNYQQPGSGGKSFNTNPFEKPTASKGTTSKITAKN